MGRLGSCLFSYVANQLRSWPKVGVALQKIFGCAYAHRFLHPPYSVSRSATGDCYKIHTSIVTWTKTKRKYDKDVTIVMAKPLEQLSCRYESYRKLLIQAPLRAKSYFSVPITGAFMFQNYSFPSPKHPVIRTFTSTSSRARWACVAWDSLWYELLCASYCAGVLFRSYFVVKSSSR